MITCVPSESGTGALVTRSRGQLTVSDISAAGSRSTIQAVDWRTFSSVSWPSIHTVPSRSMYLATRVATARTGQGLSGDLPCSASVICPAPPGWSFAQLRRGGHLPSSAGVVICPAPLGWSLGSRAGDPVGQQGLERRARFGGVLVIQQGLEIGDAQRRQPGA